MNLKEIPTKELIEELKARKLGVYPLKLSFEYRLIKTENNPKT